MFRAIFHHIPTEVDLITILCEVDSTEAQLEMTIPHIQGHQEAIKGEAPITHKAAITQAVTTQTTTIK